MESKESEGISQSNLSNLARSLTHQAGLRATLDTPNLPRGFPGSKPVMLVPHKLGGGGQADFRKGLFMYYRAQRPHSVLWGTARCKPHTHSAPFRL